MSNFQTLDLVTETLVGSAPSKFVASTTDSLAIMLAPGYLNDINKKIKANDIFDVNYSDTSVFPLNVGEAAVYASFRVQYDPVAGNWNLIQVSPAQSIIAALGVHSAVYSNAGGSATTTVSDSAISANSIVVARWQSSANSVTVERVTPSNGSLVVVSTGDPGVSVLEYISILPSVALQNAGVYAGNYSYAGGSATIVIPNANVAAGMIVNANFSSQANAAYILTAVAGAGIITIVANTNPGASVIEYQVVSPSSALTSAGLYGAAYTNAGGSATISITDANILAGSIVTADFASQANTSHIYKVTASAGTLTVLASADPGASVVDYIATPGAEGSNPGAYLISSNNLSDVASASSSLANLGGVPLAGGQMTGSLLTVKGTGTISAGAVTINAQSGVITGTFTTAAASTTSVTFNNSKIASNSVILVSLMGGSNTIPGVQLSCAYASAGVATLVVTNNNVAGSALSGTLLIGFVVL
jgi:hypothetical protein